MPKKIKLSDAAAEGLNDNQLTAIVLLADPFHPPQRVIADQLDIDEATLSRWKNIPLFKAELRRVAKEAREGMLLEVQHATFRDAVMKAHGDPVNAPAILKSRELFAKMLGGLIERQVLQGDLNLGLIDKRLAEMPDDELERLLDAGVDETIKALNDGRDSTSNGNSASHAGATIDARNPSDTKDEGGERSDSEAGGDGDL